MSRIPLAAVLLLGLAAAPTLVQAQTGPEDPAARTLQQNRRAFIPAPALPQAVPEKAVKLPPSAATVPQQMSGRRFAQAGEARMREVVTSGGFSRFRRAAETPFNLVFEVRP